MLSAKLKQTTVTIENQNSEFRANGQVILFSGYMKVYVEGKDDPKSTVANKENVLPEIKENDHLGCDNLTIDESTTKPPARFTEASLVKKMEELGIGRPATYATTISTIQKRGYIEKGGNEGSEREYKFLEFSNNQISNQILKERTGSNKGKLIPTDIGGIVNDFLVNNFRNILDYGFTAEVEKNFDQIASGNEEWSEIIKRFYKDFHSNVTEVNETAERQSGEKILGNDPKSGRVVKVRLGRFGPLAQIGSTEDEEKPIFASLTKDQQLENITLDDALDLFKLPKELGEYKNETVTVNNGRYGAYIKFSSKSISIPENHDPFTIELSEAIVLIDQKLKADEPIHLFDDLPVTKGVGRFGPYIKWNESFINVNKTFDFDNLTIENIEELIKNKKSYTAPYLKEKL